MWTRTHTADVHPVLAMRDMFHSRMSIRKYTRGLFGPFLRHIRFSRRLQLRYGRPRVTAGAFEVRRAYFAVGC
eukprot:scaffold315578_cov49-Prasinocladus_malaysianus.AAC.1